jgi:hypothetical protein
MGVFVYMGWELSAVSLPVSVQTAAQFGCDEKLPARSGPSECRAKTPRPGRFPHSLRCDDFSQVYREKNSHHIPLAYVILIYFKLFLSDSTSFMLFFIPLPGLLF